MITNDMRLYDYVKILENEAYGSEYIPPLDTPPLGQVKIAIYPSSTSTQDNILYADCSYIGLTFNAEIDDKYVIQVDKERLKVMYIQKKGRMKQVYMKRVS